MVLEVNLLRAHRCDLVQHDLGDLVFMRRSRQYPGCRLRLRGEHGGNGLIPRYKYAPGRRANRKRGIIGFGPGKDTVAPVGEAIGRFRMIRNGDRVAVALSGGKTR